MIRFRILFVFDALVALFVLQQCLQLAPDIGPYSYYNAWPLMLIQLAVLAICVGSLWWAATLYTKGRSGLASLVLLIPAVPAGLALLGLGLLILLFSMGGVHH
jgi:hypothetical protein